MSSPTEAFSPRRRAKTVRTRRSGFTLVEILITTLVALIMLFAIVEIFERVGSSVAQGRAAIEMSGQIRGAAHRLREDIRALTVPIRPWPRPSSNEGYFEIIEGVGNDSFFLPPNAPHPIDGQIRGDVDDIAMFTARSVDEPFLGRLNGQAIESQLAEIIWWTRLDDLGNISLHRRVLLIRPDLNLFPNTVSNWNVPVNGAIDAFYNDNDVSVRQNGNGLIANSLSDLTKRENRFAHGGGFPFLVNTLLLQPDMTPGAVLPAAGFLPGFVQSGIHRGDDVMLSHLQAFDIRVFDPTAQVRSDGNRSLVPSDPGWAAGANIGLGAFVDLNYTRANVFTNTLPVNFSGPAHPRSGLLAVAPASVYDTWSYHYEHDGIDQFVDGNIDTGTDGLDNDGTLGPDDVFERETSPPYPVPLRGIQIKIRVNDPDSRQVREMTVVSDFVPE